jgi:ABC-2 type transport system permease protein
VAVFFISLGLLFGSMLNVKQAGGICGALLTNLTAWLSGIWFDLDLVGESFRRIASLLPFYHAVELVQAAYMGELALVHLWWVLGWTILACLTSLGVFLRQMKK